MNELSGAVVLGAGDMGARHAAAWASLGVTVVAVCDPDTERAEATAAPFGAKACTTPEEALALEAQVISVCTPTFLHAPLTIQALESGKHVLCEKPMALTLEDAARMKEAATRTGRTLRIGFMRRFDPAYAHLHEMVRRIGRPVMAQATIAAGIRPKRLMHDAKANGGPVIDMCCHIFDLWANLFGEQPFAVSARGHVFGLNRLELEHIQEKAVDSAQITLDYPNSSVGQLQVSWGLPPGIPATEQHTYVGPDGLVKVDWNTAVSFHDGLGELRWTSYGSDPWREQIRYFYQELTQGAPRRLASIEEGIAALKISLAALESASLHQEVRLSLEGVA